MEIFDDIYDKADEYIRKEGYKLSNPKVSISFPDKPNSKYSFPYKRQSQVPFDERLKGEFFLFISNYKEEPDENDDWYAPTEKLFIKYRITLLKEESLVNQYWADYVEFLTIRINKKEQTSQSLSDQIKIPKLKENSELNETENSIPNGLSPLNGNNPRNEKKMLTDEEFSKLVEWVKSYFENKLSIPDIDKPIRKINATQGIIVKTFTELFKEKYPSAFLPDSLFVLISKCFYEYREKTVENLRKANKN
ncbi:MAG: hypothetical protein WAO52_06710 [Prolixibacteraceae bacterium]